MDEPVVEAEESLELFENKIKAELLETHKENNIITDENVDNITEEMTPLDEDTPLNDDVNDNHEVEVNDNFNVMDDNNDKVMDEDNKVVDVKEMDTNEEQHVNETIQDNAVENDTVNEDVKNIEIIYNGNSKTGFKCQNCTAKPFSTKTGLLNHMRMHRKVIQYCCSLCSQEFKSNKELIAHKELHVNDNHSFVCEICKVAFSSHLDWLEHNLSHINHVYYKCVECTRYFKQKFLYKLHLATHFDMKIQCRICGLQHKSQAVLKTHMMIHDNAYQCPECGQAYRSKTDLTQHMMFHTGVRPHQCLYCGKGFITRQAKATHTRIHTNERPYTCENCHKGFIQQTDYKKHSCKAVKQEKNYQCEICQKKFIRKLSLAAHMVLHTDYRPFPCDQCDEKFVSVASLKAHVIYKHTTETPYVCQICEHTCKTKSAINRHMNKHKLKK